MDRVVFHIQRNSKVCSEEENLEWIFIWFMFGPLGIRAAAQLETDGSFPPIGMWAGINATKRFSPPVQKKNVFLSQTAFPDGTDWRTDGGIFLLCGCFICLMLVSHANASYAHYPFLLFPTPLCPYAWQQCLVEPINQFHVNISGVGCPKSVNCVFYCKSKAGF